jgi:hypothetical protein
MPNPIALGGRGQECGLWTLFRPNCQRTRRFVNPRGRKGAGRAPRPGSRRNGQGSSPCNRCTLLCPACTLIVWFAIDLIRDRRVTAIGAATAIIVGCVGTTPDAGYVSPIAAMLLGAVAAGARAGLHVRGHVRDPQADPARDAAARQRAWRGDRHGRRRARRGGVRRRRGGRFSCRTIARRPSGWSQRRASRYPREARSTRTPLATRATVRNSRKSPFARVSNSNVHIGCTALTGRIRSDESDK